MSKHRVPVASVGRLLLGLLIVAIGVQVNWTLLPSLWAQDGGRAGIVIQHGDGSTVTQCISFDGESTTGYDLLVDSGIDLNVELDSSGAAICSIDNEGCDFPGDQCFCQCTGSPGSPCTYWYYWKWDGSDWVHSNLGAVASVVVDGDVDAWSWSTIGEIDEEPETQPPPYSFASICESSVSTLFLPIVNR